VEAVERVTTTAGSFLCADLVTKLPDFDLPINWHDYVASTGLVLRTIETTFTQTDVENPEGTPGGKVEVQERLELIRVESTED
jgi:hypothetical protein